MSFVWRYYFEFFYSLHIFTFYTPKLKEYFHVNYVNNVLVRKFDAVSALNKSHQYSSAKKIHVGNVFWVLYPNFKFITSKKWSFPRICQKWLLSQMRYKNFIYSFLFIYFYKKIGGQPSFTKPDSLGLILTKLIYINLILSDENKYEFSFLISQNFNI